MRSMNIGLFMVIIWNLDLRLTAARDDIDPDDIVIITEDTRNTGHKNKNQVLEISNKMKSLLLKYKNMTHTNDEDSDVLLNNVALAIKGFKDHFNVKLDTDVTNTHEERSHNKIHNKAINIINKQIEKMLVKNLTDVPIAIIIDTIFKPFNFNVKNKNKCCDDTVRHVKKLIEIHYKTYLDNVLACEFNGTDTMNTTVNEASEYFLGGYRASNNDVESFVRKRSKTPVPYKLKINDPKHKPDSEKLYKPPIMFSNISTFATLTGCKKIHLQDFLEFVNMVLHKKIRDMLTACDKTASTRRNEICSELAKRDKEDTNINRSIRRPYNIGQSKIISSLLQSIAYKNIENLTTQLRAVEIMLYLLLNNYKENLLSVVYDDIALLNRKLSEAEYYHNQIKLIRHDYELTRINNNLALSKSKANWW